MSIEKKISKKQREKVFQFLEDKKKYCRKLEGSIGMLYFLPIIGKIFLQENAIFMEALSPKMYNPIKK